MLLALGRQKGKACLNGQCFAWEAIIYRLWMWLGAGPWFLLHLARVTWTRRGNTLLKFTFHTLCPSVTSCHTPLAFAMQPASVSLCHRTSCSHCDPRQVMCCSSVSCRKEARSAVNLSHWQIHTSASSPPTNVILYDTLYISLEGLCWVLQSCLWCNFRAKCQRIRWPVQDQNDGERLYIGDIPYPSPSTHYVHLTSSNSECSRVFVPSVCWSKFLICDRLTRKDSNWNLRWST